jgi:hypothetical protein
MGHRSERQRAWHSLHKRLGRIPEIVEVDAEIERRRRLEGQSGGIIGGITGERSGNKEGNSEAIPQGTIPVFLCKECARRIAHAFSER